MLFRSGVDREYVTRLTGRLVLTSGSTELRVPVQAVPKPVSALTSSALTFADPVATTADLQITPLIAASPSGQGIDVELKVQDTLPLHGSVEVNNNQSYNTREGRVVRTSSLRGFLLLWLLSRWRVARRSTLRYALENERIEHWFKRVLALSGSHPTLALEVEIGRAHV